jgi:hypothetical protein
MTITELIDRLEQKRYKFGDLECVIGINRSNGCWNNDNIETYPIEDVVKHNTNETWYKDSTKINGYWLDKTNPNKIFIYVYP